LSNFYTALKILLYIKYIKPTRPKNIAGTKRPFKGTNGYLLKSLTLQDLYFTTIDTL